MALLRGWYLTCGRQRDIIDRSDKTSMAMIVMVSGEMVILPEIPLGRRMTPWSRRTNVVERVLTFRHACGTLSRRSKPETRINTRYSPQHMHNKMQSTYDAWTGEYARHGTAIHTIKHYTLSEVQYATSCILTKLHVYLFSSIPIRYTAILNVVKHGKRWSVIKLPI